jgi:RNA polymerase sigma-70 factor (ECF subfamily)
MDRDLVVRAQGGDRAAFAAIATAAYDRLHKVAHNILGDANLADDAIQSAFLAMWQGLPGLRDPERFEGWSYRTLVRACYAEARERRRWVPNLLTQTPDVSATVDDLRAVLDRDQLERGFRRLPVEQRAVIVLRFYADLTLDGVAEALNVPVGTVNSRLVRALAALRAVLDADARVPGDRPQWEVTP